MPGTGMEEQEVPGKADAVVIGAGVVGVSIAYFLAEAGIDTVLLEKGELGSGASGVNLGQISVIDRDTPIQLRWVRESMDVYKSLAKNEKVDFELDQCGGLLLLKNKAEEKRALQLVKLQKSRGTDLYYIRGKEIIRKEPLLDTKNILGAVYAPDEGTLEPLKVTLGLAELARRRGAKIFINSGVEDFVFNSGKVEALRTSRGTIKARTFVLAAGSWTRELGKKLGLRIPVYYHRGTAMVTSPRPRCINNVVVSGGFLVNKPVQKRAVGLAVAQHMNGSILLAQATEESGDYSRNVSAEGIRGIAANFLTYFPGLSGMDIIRAWAGNTPYTKDGNAVFGFSRKIPNLFIAAGLKGAFSTAPAAGRMVSEIIHRGKEIPDMAGLSPDRS